MSRLRRINAAGHDKVSQGEKYQSYVLFYINLDNLIWKNLTVGLSVTAIGLGIIGTVLSKTDFQIPFFSRNGTIAICFFLVSVFYGMTSFVIWRMRYHHELMEKHLRYLESNGYFHDRLESTRKWWLSAVHVTKYIFIALGFICFFYAGYITFFGGIIMVKTPISSDEARSQFGVFANHERMGNGELRFRLMGTDGNGYVRTVAPPGGGWQNSHSHREFRELYVVERGWMAVATPGARGEPQLAVYLSGQHYLTELDEVHNIYLSDATVIHTVKFGAPGSETSWIPNEEFTRKTQLISEEQILRAGRSNN